jgi:hypothetical protein
MRDPFPYRRFMRRHGIVFVHIPKCAGTSVLKALAGRTRPRDHFSYHVYEQADPARYARSFKFSFVRDPVSRIRSIYTYLRNGGNGTSDAPLCEAINLRCHDLNGFVEDWLEARHLHIIPLLRPQAHFIFNGYSGRIEMDFVGRHEHFERDCRSVFDRLGLRADVPFENASPPGSENNASGEAISPSATARIRDLYALDYEVLGYE